MDLLGSLLRLYSYLYQLVLSGFFFLLSFVTLISGKHNLNLPMFPWEGATLTYWLLGLSICGGLLTLLAAWGKLRFPFPLWCLFVVVMMFRAFFMSPMQFADADQFKGAIWLFVGAVGALLSAITVLKAQSARR